MTEPAVSASRRPVRCSVPTGISPMRTGARFAAAPSNRSVAGPMTAFNRARPIARPSVKAASVVSNVETNAEKTNIGQGGAEHQQVSNGAVGHQFDD